MKNYFGKILRFKKSIICALIVICAVICIFAFKSPEKKSLPVSNTKVVASKNLEKKPAPIASVKFGPFSRKERKELFSIVRKTIQDALDGKKREYPNLSQYKKKWSDKTGVYVTLNLGEKLRGCRGTQKAEKPFLHALVDASYDAAFNDSRFSKLSQEEFNSADFNMSISILGELKEMSFQNEKDIIKQMRPFEHGMLLTDTHDGKSYRGIFLPSVWKKRPEAENFWTGLKRKAKLKSNYWSDTLKVYTFDAEYIQDLDTNIHQDKQRTEMAISALKNLFNDDGSVIYEINLKDGKVADRHHLVRDMGTGYSLSYAYWMTKDPSLKPVAIKFLNYAQTFILKDGNKAFLQEKNGQGKSGAAALLLLSLMYYEKASNDTSFADIRKELANGLVSLFEKDAGIHTSPQNNRTSPYYDGETWLALAVYNSFFPEEKNVAAIMNDLDDTMYKKYYEKYLYSFFHWGSQAASFRYRTTQDKKMLKFLQHQVALYMKSQPIAAKFSTCSYLEGISETADAIRSVDPELYSQIVERMETQVEIPRLLQKQAIEKIKFSENKDTEKYSGLFIQTPKETKARNDVTQHCMISLFKANKVFEEFE